MEGDSSLSQKVHLIYRFTEIGRVNSTLQDKGRATSPAKRDKTERFLKKFSRGKLV